MPAVRRVAPAQVSGTGDLDWLSLSLYLNSVIVDKREGKKRCSSWLGLGAKAFLG